MKLQDRKRVEAWIAKKCVAEKHSHSGNTPEFLQRVLAMDTGIEITLYQFEQIMSDIGFKLDKIGLRIPKHPK
jgi:hypothetical protein